MNQNVSPAAGDAWSRVAESVAGQHWPAATLYVVATPIGNLGDLGLRAWHALQRADVIAAEDTRASRKLLDAWGVGTPLMAAHRHNEASAAQAICERLAQASAWRWCPTPARRPSAIRARAWSAPCARPATRWCRCLAPARSSRP